MKRRKRGNMVQEEASCLDHDIVRLCQHIRELCPPCKSIIKHVSVRLGWIYAVTQTGPKVQCSTTNKVCIFLSRVAGASIQNLLILGPRVKSDHHQNGWGRRQHGGGGAWQDTHWLLTTLSAIDTHHLHSHFIGQSTSCISTGPGRITLPQGTREQISFEHGWCSVESRPSGEIQREHTTATRERTDTRAVAPVMEWTRSGQIREVMKDVNSYWVLTSFMC